MKDQARVTEFNPMLTRTQLSDSLSFAENNGGELIRRVLDGEHEAFYELIRPHLRAVYMTAFSILNNKADAEEVSQEAILNAFRALKSFRAEATFSTWLIQITINEARQRIRKDRRNIYESLDSNRDEDNDYIPRELADWREIPSESLQRRELREALSSALASLPAKYREVLVLRDVNHLSIEETVKALGISESNVKTRLVRARLQMRDALAPKIDGSWLASRSLSKDLT